MIFKRLLVTSAVVSMLTSSKLNANTLKCESIQTAQEILQDLSKKYRPQDILICFDVDLTLTVTTEVAAQWPSIQNHKRIFKSIFQSLNPFEGNTLLNLSTKTQSPVLIEERAPKIIQSLIAKGAKVIALTDSMTGRLGGIESVADWRVDALERLGVDFKSSFPNTESLQLDSFTGQTERHPEFTRGVLLTDSGGHQDVTKGSVLVAFLKAMNYKPKVVILFDDRAKYFEVVESSLQSFDSSIQFIGVEYTGGLTFSTGSVTPQEFETFWLDLAQKAKSEVAGFERN